MNIKKKILALLICSVTVFSLISIPRDITAGAEKTGAEIQAEIKTLNSRMSNVNDEKKSLQNKINAAKANASSLASEMTDLIHEIDLIDEQLIIIDSLLVQFDALIAEQESEIADLEKEIKKQQRMLDDMIRMSYEYGGLASAAEFIFSAEDFSDLITRFDLLQYHLSYNDKILDNYKTSLEDLETTKAEYEASLEEMNTFKAEQEVLKGEYMTKQKNLDARRATVMSSIEEYEKDLAEKQKHIDALNAEIKKLAQMYAKEDKTTYSGSFYFPVPQNVYRITSYYGYRKDPFTGKTAYHNGYDFACAKGTAIYAADDGTVVIAGTNGGYGNCVTINHGGGIMTLYGHCSTHEVVAGQKVTKGQIIARVGSTGRSTGNHLHFTTYKNGELVDPAPYLGM